MSPEEVGLARRPLAAAAFGVWGSVLVWCWGRLCGLDGQAAADRMVAEYAPGAVIRLEPGTIRAWDYEDEA